MELENFDDHGDPGEIWQVAKKICRWLADPLTIKLLYSRFGTTVESKMVEWVCRGLYL